MTAPIVEMRRGIIVIRDDLFPGGTKARFIGKLFEGEREAVYASPPESGAQTALAFTARAMGRRATIFVAQRATSGTSLSISTTSRPSAVSKPGAVRIALMANRLLDGFDGKMTSSRWATIAKCSQDTANRDIALLMDAGLLRKGDGGGRSTHYEIVRV